MENKNNTNFDEEITNYTDDKYSAVVLASIWATKVLKRREEFKHKQDTELIKVALDDILSGRVTAKQVLKDSKASIAAQLKEEEEARKEAERKAKEPLKL